MAPRVEEWRHRFPTGIWLTSTMGAVNVPKGDGTGGTTSRTLNTAAAVTDLLTNREGGLIPNNIRDMFYSFVVPALSEDVQGISALYDASDVRTFLGITGRTGALSSTGISGEFLALDPVDQTPANAAAIVANLTANYKDHASNLGYMMLDDLQQSNTDAAGVLVMAAALQDADPYGRPATFVHINPHLGNLWADAGDDLKLAITYRYPCGRYSNGTDTAEGDFHRSTFSGIGSGDWVDALRQWIAYIPVGVPFYLVLQSHFTSGAGSTPLRAPSAREHRAQFWIALGEGAKGIYWFAGDTVSPWTGLLDTARSADLKVVRELHGRLTPEMRRALLRCERVSDQFTTTGGGTSGLPVNYTSAYVSTLLHDDGTYYVVVCNHDTSSAAVTIASGTLAGTLTNMETGDVIRVGGSVTLPALDGTLFRYAADLGVPVVVPDFGFGTVEAWWAEHYANPASANYIAPGDVVTHANEVVVAAGGLQAAIDAAPDNTTFRLQAGNHPIVTIVGRSGLHFIADDVNSKPTCRGFDVFGSTYAQQYNNFGAVDGFPEHLIVNKTAAALDAWRNPKEDFLWRDINFVSDGTPVKYQYYNIGGVWKQDHRWENVPIFLRNVKRVLIERCTVSGYVEGTNDTDPTVTGVQTTWNTTGTLINGSHPGLFCGNAGIENVVIRDCDLAGTSNASRGFRYPIFFDGARGCVFHDIRLTGKWSGGWLLLLCNNDYSFDAEYDGDITRTNLRDAWCNVVSAWACDNSVYGQTNGHSIMGGNNLLVGCTQNAPGGSLAFFVEFACKSPLAALTARRLFYKSWNNIVDDCDITAGGATTFARHDVDQGWTGISGADENHPYRSRVGYTTVKNSHVKGTLGSWTSTKAGALATVDTPHVESGNTTG